VAVLPSFYWFPDRRKILLSRGPSSRHLLVFLTEPEQMVGELLPHKLPRQSLVVPVHRVDQPFTLELRSGRAGAAEYSRRFTPGGPLSSRLQRGLLLWTLGPWHAVEASAFAWRRDELICLDRTAVNSDSDSLLVPTSWSLHQARIVLTPLDEQNQQGPTEIVPAADPPDTTTLSTVLQRLLPQPASADELERLLYWPVPLLEALLQALTTAFRRASSRSRTFFPGAICRGFAEPEDFSNFLTLYEQHPSLVHLLASDLRLLVLAVLHRVPVGSEPISAASLLARAAGQGTIDTRLLNHLESTGHEEIDFWTGLFYKRQQPTPVFYRLRLELHCPVSVEEADEISQLLADLGRSSLDSLLAELVPKVPSPLHQAIQEAMVLRTAAFDKLLPATIRQATEALHNVRRLLTEHLDSLLRERSAGRWSDLAPINQRLREGVAFSDIANLLRSLRRNETVTDVPAADFPCLLLVDALWLRDHQQRENRQRERLRCLLGWCSTLLEEGRLVPLEETTPLAAELADRLPARWQQWLTSWDAVNVERLYRAVGLSGGKVRKRFLQELAQVQALGAALGLDPSGVSLLQSMRDESVYLTVWLQQGPLRLAVQEQLGRVEASLRSTEARSQGTADLAAGRELLAGPIYTWGALPEILERLAFLSGQERDSEESWARMCSFLSPALCDQLHLSEYASPLDEGLDPITGPIGENIDRANRDLGERIEQQRTHLERLHSFGAILGLPEVVPAAERPSIEDEPHPRFAVGLYRNVLGLIRQEGSLDSLMRVVELVEREVKRELHQRVERCLAPCRAPGIALAPSEQAVIDAREVEEVLRGFLDSGDLTRFCTCLARVERVAGVLAARRDMLGLEQKPTGVQLIDWPMAAHWVRQRGDASLIGYLQELIQTPCVAVELLTGEADLEGVEACLEHIRQAGQGQPRRWWSRLYRDVAEVLRGKLAGLPRCAPPWQAPEMNHRADLDRGLAWLGQVVGAIEQEEDVPETLLRELMESELVESEFQKMMNDE
jgi:hypothetical protein